MVRIRITQSTGLAGALSDTSSGLQQAQRLQKAQNVGESQALVTLEKAYSLTMPADGQTQAHLSSSL